MDLPTPLPDPTHIRGYPHAIPLQTVLGIYETLQELLDPNDEQQITRAMVFAELVYCSQDPERHVTERDVLEYITNTDSLSPLIQIYDGGRLYIQHTIRVIILSSTEEAPVGFRLLPIHEVIEIS